MPWVFMKFHWKLLLAFYMPLHFAFGSFYIADLLERRVELLNKTSETDYSGFSFDLAGESPFFSYFDLHYYFDYMGFGLVLLSLFLPSLLLYRKYQTPPLTPFSNISNLER